jgi:hypothetical protein
MSVQPSAGQGDAGLLRARLRWREIAARPAGPGDLRVALLASYTIDPIVPYLGCALAGAGIAPGIWVGPFNQIERQCLDRDSLTAEFAPHVLVVAPRLEDLWAGLPLPLAGDPGPYQAGLLFLAEVACAAARSWRASLVFVLPAVPEQRPAGVGDEGNPEGVFAVATQAREAARRRLASQGSLSGQDRVFVLDAEVAMRAVGSATAYRPSLEAAARIPFAEKVFSYLGERAARLIALARDTRPPLIVLDGAILDPAPPDGGSAPAGTAPDDSTAPAGIAAPVASTAPPAGLAPGSDRAMPAQATSLEACLAEVSRLGALIALGNATGEARARLARLVPLSAWRGPGECAAQVREIAAELAPRRTLLMTADPATAQATADELPAVMTMTLPPERERWAAELIAHPVIDQLPPRPRSAPAPGAPGTGIPAPAGTGNGAARVPSLQAFLAGLRLEVDFAPLTPASAESAADLTRRVSEFHLDGRQWPAGQLAGQAAGGAGWTISVRDRFGDHGMSGVLIARPVQGVLTVEACALTCPVLGKGVEEHLQRQLAARARENQCHTVAFRYRPTPRNKEFLRFLTALAGPAATVGGTDLVEIPLSRLPDAPPPAAAGPAAPVPAALTPSVPGALGAPRRTGAAGTRAATTRLTTASQIMEAMAARGAGRDLDAPAAARPAAGPAGRSPRPGPEQALAGIFGEVLGFPVTGVDTSFFDSGDSMLAVQLIAKANRAGLRLTLRQVFEHQTVAGLAAVATAAQRPGDVAPDGGLTPLLPLQRWFFGLGLARPGHFNQSQRFELPAGVDVAALDRAIAALVAHHQALRVRFIQADGGWAQLDPGPPGVPPIVHVDLTSVPAQRRAAVIAGHENSLQLGMSPERGRLIQFALFSAGPAEPARLLVIVHHLAIDGISWRLILRDIQEAYRQARAGEPVSLTPVPTPVLEWARRLNGYAQQREVTAELPSWVGADRAGVPPLPLDFPGGSGAGVLAHIEEEAFSAAETGALRARAVNVDRVSVDVLLLAAANLALAEWTGNRRFLMDVVNHGRDPFMDGVDLSETVGWLVLNVPVVFDLGDGALPGQSAGRALPELVDRTGAQLRAWSAQHGAGDTLLRFLSQDPAIRQAVAAQPGAEILFSYGGHVNPIAGPQSLLVRALDDEGTDIDPDAVTPFLMQFDAMIIGDRLRLAVCCRTTQFLPATARSLLDGWAAAVRDLIAAAREPRELAGFPGKTGGHDFE